MKSGVKGERRGSAMEEEEKGTEMLASVMQIKVSPMPREGSEGRKEGRNAPTVCVCVCMCEAKEGVRCVKKKGQ